MPKPPPLTAVEEAALTRAVTKALKGVIPKHHKVILCSQGDQLMVRHIKEHVPMFQALRDLAEKIDVG